MCPLHFLGQLVLKFGEAPSSATTQDKLSIQDSTEDSETSSTSINTQKKKKQITQSLNQSTIPLIEADMQTQLTQLNTLPLKIQNLKKEMLLMNIINLKLFKTSKDDKIKEIIVKTMILIESLCSVEEKVEKRLCPKYILENKGIVKYRRKEESNPRLNNKRKADGLREKMKKKGKGVCLEGGKSRKLG